MGWKLVLSLVLTTASLGGLAQTVLENFANIPFDLGSIDPQSSRALRRLGGASGSCVANYGPEDCVVVPRAAAGMMRSSAGAVATDDPNRVALCGETFLNSDVTLEELSSVGVHVEYSDKREKGEIDAGGSKFGPAIRVDGQMVNLREGSSIRLGSKGHGAGLELRLPLGAGSGRASREGPRDLHIDQILHQ